MGQVMPLSVGAQAPAKPAGKLSYDEFLEQYADTHAEWVGGDVIVGQPPTLEHQEDSLFLAVLLKQYAEARNLGKLLTAPFQMRLSSPNVGREPDILFVLNEHVDRLKRTYLDGPADLIIEIISPESVGRDRGDKFVEYEAAGVQEYWLIDPLRKQAEFYWLENGRYQLLLSGKEGKVKSRVVDGFYLRIEWLWQVPLPPVLPILKEMGII